MKKKSLPQEGNAVSKAEDKVWHEWYNKLTPEDHCQMLAKLGLNKEEIDEFKEEVFHDTPKAKPVPAKPVKSKNASENKAKKKKK